MESVHNAEEYEKLMMVRRILSLKSTDAPDEIVQRAKQIEQDKSAADAAGEWTEQECAYCRGASRGA